MVYEEFKVLGKELVDQVGQLIHAGNVRRIIVKDDKGNTFLEIPLTVATVGAIAVPVLAGLAHRRADRQFHPRRGEGEGGWDQGRT